MKPRLRWIQSCGRWEGVPSAMRMEPLRRYLNSLNPQAQADYARRCGTTVGYLRKAISVSAKMDGALCRMLDEESGGTVLRSELRADIWPAISRKAA